jgi:hypothetical protein
MYCKAKIIHFHHVRRSIVRFGFCFKMKNFFLISSTFYVNIAFILFTSTKRTTDGPPSTVQCSRSLGGVIQPSMHVGSHRAGLEMT